MQLAGEVLRALFTPSAGTSQQYGQGQQNRPQWYCGACSGLPNNLSRKICRGCGKERPKKSQSATGQKSSRVLSEAPAPVLPRPWPVRPPAPEIKKIEAESRLQALQEAAAKLRSVGLEDEAVLLEKPASKLQKTSTQEQKPGARLDACAAYVQRAERRVQDASRSVEAAEKALEDAKARYMELEAELESGRVRLESLRVEVAAAEAPETEARTPRENLNAQTPSFEVLLHASRELLMRLENSSACNGAIGNYLPDSIVEAARKLNDIQSSMAPLPFPSLDAALEEDAPAEKAESVGIVDSESEDDVMDQLDGADDADESKLLEIARRLKRARKN